MVTGLFSIVRPDYVIIKWAKSQVTKKTREEIFRLPIHKKRFRKCHHGKRLGNPLRKEEGIAEVLVRTIGRLNNSRPGRYRRSYQRNKIKVMSKEKRRAFLIGTFWA